MSSTLRDRIIILTAGLIIFPLCFNSYGIDADGWGMVLSALRLAGTGEYIPSRFPGYPLPEFLFALVTILQMQLKIPHIYNLIVCSFSIGTVLILYELTKSFNISRPIYPALALLFTPLFLINATGTMDYNISLFFLIAASKLASDKKLFLSGMMFGLAVASRLSTGTLAVAFILLIYLTEKKKFINNAFIFALGSILSLSPFLLILYYNFGFSFLTYYKDLYPSLMIVAGRITIRSWGIIGSLFIFSVFLIYYKKIFSIKLIINSRHKNEIYFALLIIIIVLFQFFLLPHGTGYLLPMIPFILLLITKIISSEKAFLLPVVMFVSAIFADIQPTGLTMQGPVINDYLNREYQINRMEAIWRFVHSDNSGEPALIAGRTSEMLEVYGRIFQEGMPLPENVYNLPEKPGIDSLLDKYQKVVCLPEAYEAYRDYYGFNLLNYCTKITLFPVPQFRLGMK